MEIFRTPGTILSAECPCGYDTGLRPGVAAFDNKAYVIAYATDNSELITIDQENAKLAKLLVVDDPSLEDDGLYPTPYVGSDFDQGYGPYLCPSCKRKTLRMFYAGAWD